MVSLDEAAGVLGVSRSTLQRMLKQGNIRGFKVGRQWRFHRGDLDKFSRMAHPSAAAVKVTELDTVFADLQARLKGPCRFEFDPSLPGYPAAEEEHAIERAIKAILFAAVDASATDIHIDAERGETVVRQRLDGVLHEFMRIPASVHKALVAGIKLHAGVPVDQQQTNQDGRFFLRVDEREYDVRVATLPAVHGESVVLRLLDRTSRLPDLNNPNLGLSEKDLPRYRRALTAPMGLIVVAGPTGSGKTTLLYAGLQEVIGPEKKTMTVEDPVEFSFHWATQAAVNVKAGFTYEHAVRALMRHDPDVVMIGELRTLPVAEMACQIALTGHLVMSVLHASSAAGAIHRLLDMGLEPFVLSESLLCVVSQRLVRRICAKCVQPDQPPFSVLAPLVERAQAGGYQLPENPSFRRGPGCEACRKSGYRGRTGIYEVMEINPELQRLIAARAPADALRQAAVRNGMTTLAADGLRKAAEGITTVAEVARLLPPGQPEA
jgi:excisionase family DNA binding protein